MSRKGTSRARTTRLVIISGHPEYHDVREQKAFVHLVKRGVSLAILGGNSFGWHARLDHHDEHLSVWRERRLDPHPGPTATVHWISLGWNPETLTGVHGVHGVPGLLRLEHADDWPWAGVSARARLGAVLGAEYDGTTGRHTAKYTTVLASAPIAGSDTTRRVDARRASGRRVRVQRFRARLLVATRPSVVAVGALDRRALPGGIEARLSGALPGAASRSSDWSRT